MEEMSLRESSINNVLSETLIELKERKYENENEVKNGIEITINCKEASTKAYTIISLILLDKSLDVFLKCIGINKNKYDVAEILIKDEECSIYGGIYPLNFDDISSLLFALSLMLED